MPQLNRDEFKDVLLEIVNKMAMPNITNAQKDDLVEKVLHAFEKNLLPGEDFKIDSKELKSDAFRKNLINALTIGRSMQKDPSFKFDLSILFKKGEIDKKELNTELQKLFMHLYKLEPSAIAGNKKLEEEMEKFVDELSKEILKNRGEEEMLAQGDTLANVLTPATDPLAASFIQEFGQDTRVPGALAVPVQSIKEGVVPWADKGGGTFLNSLIGENDQIEGPDTDPTGARARTKEHLISMNALSAELEEDFEHEGLLHDRPKPMPGGSPNKH